MDIEAFDILEYIEGLTAFAFDESILKRIAQDRGVDGYTAHDQLTQRDKDLLRADLLYTAYCSPNMIASHTNQHGSYSKTVGAQTINRKELFEIFAGIYRMYGEGCKVDSLGGEVRWVNEPMTC